MIEIHVAVHPVVYIIIIIYAIFMAQIRYYNKNAANAPYCSAPCSVHVAFVVLFLDTLKDLFISDLLLEQSKLKTFEQVSQLYLILYTVCCDVMCCKLFRDLFAVYNWSQLFTVSGSDVGYVGGLCNKRLAV